jgi:uncharacterized RDD family membrane protein YckC
VSDIPVGSPPAPHGRHAAPGGWYPDPVDPARERYWDGWQWSRNTRPRPSMEAPPPAPSAYPAGPVGGPFLPAAPSALRRPTTADGVPLAGWWWRVLAVVIDGLIIGVLTLVPTAPIYVRVIRRMLDYMATQPPGTVPDPAVISNLIGQRDQMLLAVAQIAVALVFHVTFLRWKAATPGKLLLGLRVVPVDRGRNTEPLSWGTILLRSVLWVVPGAMAYLLIFQLVDVLLPLWHPKRQSLHDLAARTQVVAVR